MCTGDGLLDRNLIVPMSKGEQFCLWLLSIWLFSFGAYIFWESYRFGGYAKPLNSLIINSGVFLFLVMSVYGEVRYSWNIDVYALFSVLCLGVFCVHGFIGTGDGIVWSRFFTQVKFFLVIVALMFMPDCRKRFIFDKFAKLFIVFTVPSILAYALYCIGIEIPYRELSSMHPLKSASGTFYRLYPCGLILSDAFASYLRPSGIYDEPGVIGTIAGFIFCGGYRTLGEKWLIALFMEGLFSTSMAFYMIIVIFLLVRLWMYNWKAAVSFLLAVVFGLFVFKNIEIENEFLVRQQRRIDFSSPFLIRDNRSLGEFDEYFSEFIDNWDYNTFMGNGMDWYISSDAADTGSYSLKTMGFAYGLLGLAEWFLFFGFMVLYFSVNVYSLPFLTIFVASLYQRPDIMSLQALIIFGTAMATLNWCYRKEHVK